MTHTPGPWSIAGQLIIGARESLPNPKAEARGKCVAAICWDFCGDRGATEPRISWHGEGEANARLIAAAPELLEAAEAIMEFYQNGTPLHSGSLIISDLAQAIAKAKGIHDATR